VDRSKGRHALGYSGARAQDNRFSTHSALLAGDPPREPRSDRFEPESNPARPDFDATGRGAEKLSFLRGRSATRPWERGPSQTASTSQDIFDSIGPAPRDKDPFRWGGDLRMSSRTRNLLLAAAIPVVMVVVAFSLLPSGSASVSSAGESAGKAVAPSSAPTVVPRGAESDGTNNDTVEQGRRAYAVAVPELKGLPPEAIPGTRLELWVAWDPPVTKQPRVQ
jgi:hypothetical protein